PSPSPTRGEGIISDSLPPCGGGPGWGVTHRSTSRRAASVCLEGLGPLTRTRLEILGLVPTELEVGTDRRGPCRALPRRSTATPSGINGLLGRFSEEVNATVGPRRPKSKTSWAEERLFGLLSILKARRERRAINSSSFASDPARLRLSDSKLRRLCPGLCPS